MFLPKLTDTSYEYIKWLQSLLDTTSPSYDTTPSTSRPITGIDIGTGSSAIYPLLGCATRPSWNFIGTELDTKSYSYATQNVEANDLTSRIRVHKVSSPTAPLIPLDDLGMDKVDFTMCNPPFFTSATDMTATHLTKARSPSAICSGALVEMIYDGDGSDNSGGDLGFVMRMLDESMVLRERVQWYTSMLGKLASATALVQELKKRGVSNWAVTSLQAGNVTRRWVVGWSFGDRRARNVSIWQSSDTSGAVRWEATAANVNAGCRATEHEKRRQGYSAISD
jgi:23S rRNA (adenine1618-N6)-methyltransferase